MRFEASVIKFSDGVLEVLQARELNGARAIFEHIAKAHISGLAHVILQVLPAARRRQPGDNAAEGGPAGGGTFGATALSVRRNAGGSTEATALGELHAQLVAVVVVAIAAMHSIFSISEKNIDGVS